MKKIKKSLCSLEWWITILIILMLSIVMFAVPLTLKSGSSWINENALDYSKIINCLYLMEETEETYRFILCVRPVGAESHSEYIATIRKNVDFGTAHAMATAVLQQIRSKWLTDWNCAPLEAYDFVHNRWTIVMFGAQDING